MKRIEVIANDAAEKVIVGVLTHLEHLSDKDETRTIRIGGDEKIYDGSVCEIDQITVDGQTHTGYTPVVPARRQRNHGCGQGCKCSSQTANTNVSSSTAVPTVPPSVSAVAQATKQGVNQGANMNQDLEEKVDVILTDLCEGEGLFTAYDITKEIRNGGTRCRHAEIRKIVHDAYNNGEMDDGYTRSLIFVDGNVQAFVYHPSNVDPNVYNGATNDADDADDTDASQANSSTDPLDALD